VPGGGGRAKNRVLRTYLTMGVAALGLAVAVVFVPGLAPGLRQVASPGQMGGM